MKGKIVLIQFPFDDLSSSKVRHLCPNYQSYSRKSPSYRYYSETRKSRFYDQWSSPIVSHQTWSFSNTSLFTDSAWTRLIIIKNPNLNCRYFVRYSTFLKKIRSLISSGHYLTQFLALNYDKFICFIRYAMLTYSTVIHRPYYQE